MAETEAVLLRRFTSSGDAEAFAEITRRHAGLVYGAALRILADVDRAADVAQETFLQLTKDAHSVTGSLPGWLHRVATHKAIDRMRRDTSRRRREVEYASEQPHEATDWKELSRYVDEELNRLDNETREILVAHFLQGRTTRQIAMTQGVSQATVSRRVEAGVTRMRGTLRKRGILVAAGALSMLLSENAVQAAPPALMAELGKMALIGGHAAVISATGSAGSSGIQTLAGGALAGVKAKAVTVAAVAVIGAGSFVTYQHATRPPSSENIILTRSPTSKAPSRTIASSPVSSPQAVPAATAGPSDAARKWNELMRARMNQTGSRDSPVPQDPMPQPEMAAADEPAAPEGAVAMAPGFAMGGVAPTEPQEEEPREEPVQPAMGGMYFFGGASPTPPVPLPPDSNDSNDTSPEEP